MKVYFNLDKYFLIYNTLTQHCETVYDSISNIVHCMGKRDVLFVGEEHFVFTKLSVSYYASTPFTLKEQKQFIQQHIFKERKQNSSLGQLLHFEVFDVYKDGNKEQFVLGKTGQLQFNLHCIYSNTHSDLEYGYLTEHDLEFYPSSYYTVLQTREQFPHQEYHMLYIDTNSTKLITINNGFYKATRSINIGTHILKTMYHEQHIPKIYRDPSKINPINLDIAKEVSSFFVSQLMDWILSFGISQGNMLVVSELTKNYILMDVLKSSYNNAIWWYIIPLSDSSSKGFIPVDLANYLKVTFETWNKK